MRGAAVSAILAALGFLLLIVACGFGLGVVCTLAFLRWWALRLERGNQARKPACLACGRGAGEACQRLVCDRYGDEHRAIGYAQTLH